MPVTSAQYHEKMAKNAYTISKIDRNRRISKREVNNVKLHQNTQNSYTT